MASSTAYVADPSRVERSNLLNEYRLSPDEQEISFGADNPRKPWRKVALALTLLVFGTTLLFLGVGLFVTGQPNSECGPPGPPPSCCVDMVRMHARQAVLCFRLLCLLHLVCHMRLPHAPCRSLPYSQRLFCMFASAAIPLLVLGSVAFIPGMYYTRVAYLAWQGYRGYSLTSSGVGFGFVWGGPGSPPPPLFGLFLGGGGGGVGGAGPS